MMRRRTRNFDQQPQSTRYALEALQRVFARIPWGTVMTFSDGRRAVMEPVLEPRWAQDAKGTVGLVEGGFAVRFLDGGHFEFLVQQSGKSGRRGNPQARAEYRDLVTGDLMRPGSPGSIATGKYVMRVRPAPGQPMEIVEVDREDLDPAKDTFGVSKETYSKYQALAVAQARAKAAELKRIPSFDRDSEARIPGIRATFSSPADAAKQFISFNPSLWALGWADVADQVEDWMDRTEIRVRGKTYAALNRTRRGQELLELFRRGQNDRGLEETLAYLFGQAHGRRWENVPWDKVESLVEIFAESARREADRIGDTDFLVGGIPHVAWLPPAVGFHAATPEFLQSLSPHGQAYYRRYAASQRLYGLVDQLEKALRQARRCLTADERRVVRDRIKTVRRWAKHPDQMPEWACASFQEPAEICDLLGIETELSKLSAACDLGYDASWGTRTRDTIAPGMGVLPEAAALEPGDDDLDLPWETAANPAGRQRRRRR